MLILDGKVASTALKQVLIKEVQGLLQSNKRIPHLAAILVGTDGASETYVANKVKTCEEVGIKSTLVRFPDTIEEQALLQKIKEFNNNNEIDGILVQLPLPPQVSEQNIIQSIYPSKDVDGFHPQNAGKLMLGMNTFISATPLGVKLLLEHYNIQTTGKHAVIIGRSNIVGRPLSVLLSTNQPYGNCTVTLCHSRTPDLKEVCLQADILVAALGRPEFVKADMVKEGAVVIDVGITRVSDLSAKKGYRLKGDVDFTNVAPKTSAITPVPGGVGLMTITALLTNTLQAYRQNSIKSNENIEYGF